MRSNKTYCALQYFTEFLSKCRQVCWFNIDFGSTLTFCFVLKVKVFLIIHFNKSNLNNEML